MSIIVDSSIWIDYFKNGSNDEKIDFLINENLVATNDLILTELIPFLQLKKQYNLIKLLSYIDNYPINIDWNQLMEYQYKCLKNGLNGVGIPDLIIVQNAIQNHSKLFSLDKHFNKITAFLNLKLF